MIKIHSIEDKRLNLTKKQVNDYFNDLENVINVCPCAPIIKNLDESGFIQRLFKKKYEIVFLLKIVK